MPRTPLLVAILAALTSSSACEDPERPWSAPPQRQVVDESRPFLASSQEPSWLGDAGFGDAGLAPDAGELPPVPSPTPSGSTSPLAPESRVGGMWASCHDGFEATAGPVRDVTRLGILCGPANGMKRLGKTVRGAIASDSSVTHDIEAVAGGCYRVFAAASGVADIVVEVRRQGPNGTETVASDTTNAPWAVLDHERPFCTFDAARLTVSLRSAAGRGRYALQVWQLPPSKAR